MADNAGTVLQNGAAPGPGLRLFRGDAVQIRRALRWAAWLSVPVVLLIAVAGFLLYLTAPLRAGEIARGVRADSVDLSGLTPDEAQARLGSTLPPLDRSMVTLEVAGQQTTLSAAQLGASWHTGAAVQAALAVGRDGGLVQRLTVLAQGLRDERHIQVPISIERGALLDALQPLGRSVEREPRNAGVDMASLRFWSNNPPVITPSQDGQRLDVAGSAEKIAQAIQQDPGKPAVTVELPLYVTHPQISQEMLSSIDGVVGVFTTQYHPYQTDRTHNLSLAASALNGTVIFPGQVFSYNHKVGKRTIAKGYRAAPIFLNGQVIDDTGGGVCQVASTVYNAALMADLKIVERNHHSMRTSYIEPGRDATVAWPDLDLKLKNTRPEPILLTADLGGGDLSVKIWGHKVPGQKVSVYTTDEGGGVAAYRLVVDPDGTRHRHEISWDPYPSAPHE